MLLRAVRKVLVLSLVVVATVGARQPTMAAPSVSTLDGAAASRLVARLAGSDRYGTAVALSKETFGANVGFAVIATGASFPDALAGAAAAGAKGGPVLLVERDRVPLAVTTELLRLSPTRLLVVGGPQAISDSVLSSLRITNNVERVAGNDRVETAADVSAAVFKPGVPVAFVATAWAFPDALAGAAAAGAKGGPVLLVNGNTVPDATRERAAAPSAAAHRRAGRTWCSGRWRGERAGSYAPRVDRLAGSDRYATAAAISTWAWPNGASQAYVASGDGFADALAAAAAGGATKRPLLLVPGGALPGVVASELDRLGVTRVALHGGATAVTDTVVSLLSGLAPPAPAPALGPYKFDSSTATGAPFRWNPCAPVPWVLKPRRRVRRGGQRPARGVRPACRGDRLAVLVRRKRWRIAERRAFAVSAVGIRRTVGTGARLFRPTGPDRPPDRWANGRLDGRVGVWGGACVGDGVVQFGRVTRGRLRERVQLGIAHVARAGTPRRPQPRG